MKKYLGLTLFAGLAMLAGCDKTIHLKFQGVGVPGGEQLVDVSYDKFAKAGTGQVGMIRTGQTYDVKFVVSEDDLPGVITWRAGPLGGQLQIAKNSPGEIIIPVDQHTDTGPMGAHGQAEIKRDRTVKTEGDNEMMVTPDAK